MATNQGGIYIDPTGQTAVVTITAPNGSVFSLFSDRFLTTPVTQPVTISSRTAFYSNQPGAATVSVKIGGVEFAGGYQTTLGYTFASGAISGISIPGPDGFPIGATEGAVLSVFGRGGAVVAATNDYTPAQVGAVASGASKNVLAASTTVLTSSSVTGDTNDRFDALADGSVKWGPGNTATDTTLARSALGALRLSGTSGGGTLLADNQIIVGSAGSLAGLWANTWFGVKSNNAAVNAIVLQAAASQSADMIDIYASDGTTKLASVSAAGAITSASINVPAGTAGAPTVQVGEATTGIFCQAAGYLGLAAGGAEALRISVQGGNPVVDCHSGILGFQQGGISAFSIDSNQNCKVYGRLMFNSSPDVSLQRASANVLSLDDSAGGAASFKFIDAGNIILGTTTGTKIGTATTQKLAFFNSTPIVQPSAVGTATGFAAGSTVVVFHSDDTYTGNVGSTAYTINGVVAALKNLGMIAA